MGLKTDGSTGYLRHDMTGTVTYPFSVFIWAQENSYGTIFSCCDPSSSAHAATVNLGITNNNVTMNLGNYTTWGSGVSSVADGTDYVPNFAPVLAVCTSNSSFTLYTPGHPSGYTFNPGNPNPGEFPTCTALFAVAFMNGGSIGPGGSYDIAEFARWNSALSASDYTTLAGGAKPETVESSSMYDNWDLKTLASSYTGLTNGKTLTVYGGVIQSSLAHPVTRTSTSISGNITLGDGVAAGAFALASSIGGNLTLGDGVAAGAFSTSATAYGFSTPPIKNNTSTLMANIGGWTVNVYNASTGALVTQITGLSTNSAGVLTVSSTLLSPGAYVYEVAHATYGRRLPVGIAA